MGDFFRSSRKDIMAMGDVNGISGMKGKYFVQAL